ncbi:MAG TPA: hypothetical protein VH165_04985 [Kofleriaceae bacterium]|nr:hypothetical protein [Kofleriaceae bacterium]
MSRCAVVAAVLAALPAACGSGGAGDASADAQPPADQQIAPAADWVLAVQPDAPPAGALPATLLGHYDLSGALYNYAGNTTLIDRMKAIGFAEWRVGLGRWEMTTRLLPTLADGHATSCATQLAALPAQAQAPAGATDDSLITDRDWFTDNGQPVTPTDLASDARYKLDYVRGVLDTAAAFGATPFVDIDHMPRALGVSRTFVRAGMPAGVADPCLATWTNHVSNTRPADPNVFATAVVGAVRRIVEGSPGAAPRDARYWEIWNEPELGYAWDPSFEQPPGSLDAYFATAVTALTQLAAYRAGSANPHVTGLRFGLGSFAYATTAVTALHALDTNPLPDGTFAPIDFVSFHAYSNDPQVIVDAIQQVVTARAGSTHYRGIELALSEWGPDLTNAPAPTTMDTPLLVATVLARGAALGLEHAHHSLFYAFVPGLPYAAVAADGSPLPLYHAYELLHDLIGTGADRLAIAGAPDGALDGGTGAVVASHAAGGPVRVLVVNRGTAARTARVDAGGATATPSRVDVFDDPAAPPHPIAPSAVVSVPAHAIVLITL